MSTSAFSKSVLSQFSDDLSAIREQFAESERAQESARKAVARLIQKMTSVEVNLRKSEKDQVRSGRKNLNKQTFNSFVAAYLARCSGSKHIDDIVKAARDQGMTSVNKSGLRESVTRALMQMSSIPKSGVKSKGDGFYSA